MGSRVAPEVVDDEANPDKGKAVAKALCDDPKVLAVVGHVNSGVMLASEKVYADCGLPVLTPMASNPAITEQGLANVFRLTNRDDRKGPALARWLMTAMGKRAAVVVDDGTPYGKGVADQFASGFAAAGGAVITRWTAKQGQTDFSAEVAALPKDFDVLFFGGIKEGAYILKDMRKAGLNQVFACGDGCWSANGFIKPAEAAATQGEGVRILSAAPAVGEVPGSAEFADRYKARFGPINNYAASSYDSARIVMAAIENAAKAKGRLPSRADVQMALKGIVFPGVAYGEPAAFDAKGDNKAAVIFVNAVEGAISARSPRSAESRWGLSVPVYPLR
jgi:branched-chain amino acid transport system substrate-binding protein